MIVQPQETLTLQVETLAIDASESLVELTWSHNGSVIVPSQDQRVNISINNKTLTVTNFTTEDAGVYKVQFNQFLVYPFDRYCSGNLITFARNRLLLKPVIFCVNLNETDCLDVLINDEIPEEISVNVMELGVEGTINTIILEANSMSHSIDEIKHLLLNWYLRGHNVTSGLSAVQTHYQTLHQRLQQSNITYEMTGRYDVVLTLDLYTYLTALGCSQYYSYFVSTNSYLPRYIPLASGYTDIGYYKG